MQLVQQTEAPKVETKFMISCEYFNKKDESTHVSDFTVDLSQSKLDGFDINKSKLVSAAQLDSESLFTPSTVDF